jgi:hypothetical protein
VTYLGLLRLGKLEIEITRWTRDNRYRWLSNARFSARRLPVRRNVHHQAVECVAGKKTTDEVGLRISLKKHMVFVVLCDNNLPFRSPQMKKSHQL